MVGVWSERRGEWFGREKVEVESSRSHLYGLLRNVVVVDNVVEVLVSLGIV